MVKVERLTTKQAWEQVEDQLAALGFDSVKAIRQAVLDENIEAWDWRLSKLGRLLWLLGEPPVSACCVDCLRETLGGEG